MKHTPLQATALVLVLTATDAARAQLARYALVTDTPAWGALEAADLLDAERAMLVEGGAP